MKVVSQWNQIYLNHKDAVEGEWDGAEVAEAVKTVQHRKRYNDESGQEDEQHASQLRRILKHTGRNVTQLK